MTYDKDERAWCRKPSSEWSALEDLAYRNVLLWATCRVENGKIVSYGAEAALQRVLWYRDGKSIQEIDAITHKSA